jgi:hypothetical protein
VNARFPPIQPCQISKGRKENNNKEREKERDLSTVSEQGQYSQSVSEKEG